MSSSFETEFMFVEYQQSFVSIKHQPLDDPAMHVQEEFWSNLDQYFL